VKESSLLPNLLVSAAVSVTLLWGAELLCRRYEPAAKPPGEHGPPLWEEEWQGNFYTVRSLSAGWPPAEEINRDGVRDRLHTLEKPDGVHRVVCLGDSVTLGYGYSPQEAFPQTLEARLQARGPGVEVFNIALPGWSTLQERIAYERIGRKYRPDQVILGVCLNDIQELENNLVQPPRLLATLHAHSALVRRIVNAKGREIASIEELFKDSPQVAAGFERMFVEVRKLREEVRADGGELVVVVFPFRDQVRPEPPEPRPQERISSFCAREGIPFLDVLASLKPLGEAAFLDELHFTPEGSGRVAAAVSSFIPGAAFESREVADLSVETLLLRLRDADRPRTRLLAAWALGRIRAPEAVAGLTRALSDETEGVRSEASHALGEIGPGARDALPTLVGALRDPRQSVRWSAARALVGIGLRAPDDVRELMQGLRSDDFFIRGFAAFVLSDLDPPPREAIPALLGAMKDPDQGVRSLVVRALGALGSGEAPVVDALAEALQEKWSDRWRAARSLGRIGPAAAPSVPALMKALGDGDPRLRREAAQALGRIGPRADAAVQALAAARRDSSDDVRAAAARALSEITSHPATERR
jgi:HEAT repeat protein/lysophospholipase L1-like esterase